MAEIKLDTLRWAVGLLSALIGAMMLIVPGQFASPVYAALQPRLGVWGIAFLLIGIGLLIVEVARPRWEFILAIHLAAGAEFLLLAYDVATMGGWTGTANFAALGLGVAAAPFLARGRTTAPTARPIDLFTVVVGLGAAFTGVMILAVPQQFSSPIYDMIRPYLPLFGAAFLAGGLALTYVQLWPAPRAAYVAAHLAAGGALLAFFAASAVPLHAWIDIAYYGGYGALLALLPWVEEPLRRVKPTSLGAQLALALSLAASVPLVIVTSLVIGVFAVAPPEGRAAVRAASQDLAFYILLAASALAVLIGVAVANRLAAPLNALARAAARLAAGDSEAPLPQAQISEVQELTSSFSIMRERLATRTAEQQRLLAGLREANGKLVAAAIREQALAESAQRRAAELDATLEAIGDALIIYGPQGEIVRMNRAAGRLLGLTQEEYIALSPEARVQNLHIVTQKGTPIPVEQTASARALRGETVAGLRETIRRRDGSTRELLASAGPIHDLEGHIIGAVRILSDVTPLVELQRQREDILRAVSHDLRNPLSAVQAQAQLLLRLQEHSGHDGREHASAESILASAQRMNTMIQDLVDTARSEAGTLELNRRPVDLRPFALGLKQEQAAALEAGRIQVEIPEELPPVSADPNRLERILTNLWSNALKYSTPGTPVTVSAARVNGEVITSVTDRGPGIPPEQMSRLFQRYSRTEAGLAQRESVGLGLYITRLLVEAHGGRAWAESRVGVGSTFSFSLPIVRETAERQTAGALPEQRR